MRMWMMAALLAAGGAQAAERPANGPVTVEVIGSGAVEVKATAQRLSIAYTGRGRTAAAAEADRARREAEVLRLLAADGVPASAIAPLSDAEQTKLSLMGALTDKMTVSDVPEGAEAEEEAKSGRTVEVATLAQAQALTTRLKAAGAQVGDPTPVFGDVSGARRDARLLALQDARAGAARYAAALGMKLGSIRRVSETGDGAMLPGLQEKIGTLIATGGPGLMAQMMAPAKDSVKVEEAVVAEFMLER